MNLHENLNAWAQKIENHNVYCKVCGDVIPPGQQYYYVTELKPDARGLEQPVCFRHLKGARP